MKGAIFVLTLLLGTPPSEWVVEKAEPLDKVAARALGDPKAASELKALNGLKSDTVPAGTTLKLPERRDRALALSALVAARNAVEQADRKVARREEAAARLKEAEASFQTAHYADAAQAADSAWQLVSGGASQRQAFSVDVSDGGDTTVIVHSGRPVGVESEGVTRPVSPGQTLRVEKGQPPPQPTPSVPAPSVPAPSAPVLASPRPTAPAHKKRLTLPPSNGLLGPVTLTWSAVEGATGYEVEVLPANKGEPVRMNVNTAQAKLPALPPGSYRWTVRAVGKDAKSEASTARHFELVDGSLKLEVKGSQWK